MKHYFLQNLFEDRQSRIRFFTGNNQRGNETNRILSVEEITSKDLGDAEDKMTMGFPANLDRDLHSTAERKGDDRSFRRPIPRLPEASPVPAALWISEKEDAEEGAPRP